jgi:hypothetical protein
MGAHCAAPGLRTGVREEVSASGSGGRSSERGNGIADSGLDVLYDISHGHTLLARVEMARRMRASVRQNHGFPGFFKSALQALGLTGEDSDLAARYTWVCK